MTRHALVLAVSLGVAGGFQASAVQSADAGQLFSHTSDIPDLIARGALKATEIPNPHWRDDACIACHKGNPEARPVRLNAASATQVCNQCHDALFDHSYIHPVDLKPGREMIKRMPESYRSSVQRSGGNVSCITCHDVPAQCLRKRRRERGLNPLFFRGGPFRVRTAQCFFCHDQQGYRRVNPHDQIKSDGTIRETTCRLCHTRNVRALQASGGNVQPVLLDSGGADSQNPSALCIRCHRYKPHPGGSFGISTTSGVNHLVVPKNEILDHMQKRAKQIGASLPRDNNSGLITCWTCHEPHQPGVLKGRGSAKQPLISKRIRTGKLCQRCHPL